MLSHYLYVKVFQSIKYKIFNGCRYFCLVALDVPECLLKAATLTN